MLKATSTIKLAVIERKKRRKGKEREAYSPGGRERVNKNVMGNLSEETNDND